jgi:hypothetical protein
MTQDQYGQARGPGNVIHGDPVPEEETDERQTDDTKPMTRFQKVASALRGDRTDRDEADMDEMAEHRPSTGSEDATGSDVMAPGGDTSAMSPSNPPYVTERDEAAMTDTPVYRETGEGRTPAAGDIGPAESRAGEPSAMSTADADAARHDYWEEPVAAGQPAGAAATRGEGVAAMDPDVPVDETAPDVPVSETRPVAGHPATEPDMFGTAPAAGQPGAATIADVPAGASVETATGAEETAVPDAATGRHAAAAPVTAPADRDLRPGEAAGSLGDFSDLTFGDLIPDAAHYTEQWQQIQFRFVDDPHASVTEAADIVAQVTAKLEGAIQERQRAIEERQRAITEQQRSLRDRWGEGSNADTENLRATLRMYKTFLDQLIGPRA